MHEGRLKPFRGWKCVPGRVLLCLEREAYFCFACRFDGRKDIASKLIMAASYCEFAQTHPLHRVYHDTEYGFPVRDDSVLLERLALEIGQAGLSWETILKKKDSYRLAFEGFDLDSVAAYDADDEARLMADAGIVRSRLKIRAVMENARRLIEIRSSYGSFAAWLDTHHPRSPDEWQRLFKKTFVFTGSEITRSFLVSTGYLPGAHDDACPVYRQIALLHPPWLDVLEQRKAQEN